MSGEVRRLHSLPRPETLTVEVPEVYPRVRPGAYVAITRNVVVIPMFRRRTVRVLMDLYTGASALELAQPPIARVPFFMAVPTRSHWRPAATSALTRFILSIGIQIPQRGPLPLRDLVGKVLGVEVGDVTTSRERDAQKQPISLPTPLIYSVVRRVTERLS